MTASKRSFPFFNWNDGECTMAPCRYAHNVCSVCCGAHKNKNCQTQIPSLLPAASEFNFSGGPAILVAEPIPSDVLTGTTFC